MVAPILAGEAQKGRGPSCLACGDRHWTPYQYETLEGEQEEAWELCPECNLIIPEKKLTRKERGEALAEARFDEIVKIRPWTYSVPSESHDGFYEVNLKHGSCSCPDAVHSTKEKACKHLEAVRHIFAISGECAGCRKRFRWRELIEVTEDHESLSWFVGDRLCVDCSRATGIS